LAKYIEEHLDAEVDVYRKNNVSIHLRVVDPDFKGVAKAKRHDLVWRYLEQLPKPTLSNISVLLLLSPYEKENSIANLDFDDPIPSML
jgi:hypothetical protein